MNTVREAHTAEAGVAHAAAAASPPFPETQSRPANPLMERMFGVAVKSSPDAQKGLDRLSLRWLKWLCLALLAFFVIVSTLSLTKISVRHNVEQSQGVITEASERAALAASVLDKVVAWMDTAANAPSRAQMVALAAQGADIAGAALVADDGKVVVAQPAGYEGFFASVPVANTGGIDINAVYAQDGSGIFATVSRPVLGGRLVVALPPLALSGGDDAAILSPSGRVIDGPARLASGNPASTLGLGPDTLRARINALKPDGFVEATETMGGRTWTGFAPIPNTDLAVVHAAQRSSSATVRGLAIVFVSLALGTAAIVAAILQSLFQHIDRAQTEFAEDEVSRQRYQTVMDNAGGGIFEVDLTSNEAFLSASLTRLLNLGGDERVLSVPEFLGLFHDHDREGLYNGMRRAQVSGEFSQDVRVQHLPLVLSCQGKSQMRGAAEHGTPDRKVIMGLAIDVTEARGAQARLQAAEARLFDALGSMSDSFVIWDRRNQLVLWNSRFEDFFGFAPGQLQPGLDHATVSYHANASVIESIAPDVTDGSVEMRITGDRWIRYQESATLDGGRVAIGTEITQVRRRETELRINHEKLQDNVSMLQDMQHQLIDLAQNYETEKIRAEEANQSKSEFLANMSHELRTPLNAINGFSDIMNKEMFGPLGDPRYKEYVSDILFSGRHLLSLINDILDMSKIEAGKMTLNVDTLHINDMIQQVIRILRGRAEENRLKLVFNEVQAQAIQADPRAVKQILLNLITNAIKFTPENGVVRVMVEPKATGIIVRVADSGIGIGPEDLKKLAQPFEQASNNTSGEGTGLGLALSKSLVELHGGNFGIASTVGEGTTITFTLPNAPIVTAQLQGGNVVSEEISRIASTISNALQQGADAAQEAAEAGGVEPQQAGRSAA